MQKNSLQDNRIIKVARDVMLLSRNSLLVNMRFLDLAISKLELVPIDGVTYMTDGVHLGFGPRHVLSRFKKEREQVSRDYLHVMLHCVFSHMFVGTLVNQTIWDLACDIAVENTITELDIKATESERQSKQLHVVNELKSNINMLTAEKIYAYYLETNLSDKAAVEIRNLFIADDHTLWFSEENPFAAGDKNSEEPQQSGSGDGTRSGKEDKADDNNDNGGKNNQSVLRSDQAGLKTNLKSQREIEEEWKSVAEKIQQDLETFSKERGDTAGGMMQNLHSVNREKYDYTSFLKKFAVLGEAMVINDEEFDYIFYTYGLKLYGKVPLIEPLEYKEVKRIKEFVIAIDTSGSTSGEIVQKFVQKTYNILKTTESFFTKVNIHIIQCDADIQEHVKITTEEEFNDYMETMTIHGLGGTDFRPVFDFVDDLIEAEEFTNLKGLIYFTDGFGVYPDKKPVYETAFVFLDDDYNNPEVPPWAIKLVLQTNEI